MSSHKVSSVSLGIGLGLLTGVMIGMSISPVVGQVLGLLVPVGLSAGVLFANGNATSVDCYEQHHHRLLVAVFFVWFCLFGLFGGVYVRTHSILSPSPQPGHEQGQHEWTVLFGISEDTDGYETLDPQVSTVSSTWLTAYRMATSRTREDPLHKLIDSLESEEEKMKVITEFWMANQTGESE